MIGVSYAYWSLTFNQKENNVVTTDCFEIEFIEGNAINLSKAYPMSDSDGMKNVIMGMQQVGVILQIE